MNCGNNLAIAVSNARAENVRVYWRAMTFSIAIVEDDASIRNNYVDVLQKQGYRVSAFADRPAAEAGLSESLPDLAVIDIGLGTEVDGGFALCRWLRTRSETLPIIFLSARDSDLDIVSGLRMGADDYLTKDISLPHLVARIAALFRRLEAMQRPAETSDLIERGKLRIDTSRMNCQWDSEHVGLTLTEFWMVYSLANRPGHVKSRDALMQESRMVVDDSTITSHIKRIRKKFLAIDNSFDAIETVYGMGYRWNEA